MPDGCDCVRRCRCGRPVGPLAQVMAEAVPGQGVRRAGSDIAAGSRVAAAGRRILPRDLLLARAAGLTKLARAPAAPAHRQYSRRHADRRPDRRERAQCRRRRRSWRSGRRAMRRRSPAALDARRLRSARHHRRQRRRPQRCDGAGAGQARRGDRAWHRAAARPHLGGRADRQDAGRRAAGRAGPGVCGMVDAGACRRSIACRAAGRARRSACRWRARLRPSVGIAEIVLLERKDGAWMTLAVGELSLEAIARAEAWLAGSRRLRGICGGHAGRCLYAAGMIRASA